MRAFKPEEIINKNYNPKKVQPKALYIGFSVMALLVVFINMVFAAKDNNQDIKAEVTLPPVVEKVYAAAINVGGSDVIYLKDDSAAEAVLEEVKQANLPKEGKLKVKSITYKDEVKIQTVLVEKESIKSNEEAVKYLLFGNVQVQKYEAKEGDNLWVIARKNNMRVKEILAANPGLDESKLAIGQVVLLNRPQPQITVVAVLEGERKRQIPHETEIRKDKTLRSGKTKVIKEGKAGTRLFEYEITLVNGFETDKKILSDKIVEKPVTKIIASGSARRTQRFIASRGDGGSGNLLWPTRGKISSHFGYRGREFHTGMDIDASMGDAVVASDGGKVIMTGWSGGYGKTVVVDHGNGVVTRYAHLSSYSVNEGENVGRGDYIGAVGSTGRSTGSHLHYEVIINGQPQNPLRHLN